MNCYYEANYGADADGNRGTGVMFCEVNEDDFDDVVEQLYERFCDNVTSGTVEVNLICHIDDEHYDVEVDVEDYVDGLIEKALNDDDNDAEFIEWVNDLKREREAKDA